MSEYGLRLDTICTWKPDAPRVSVHVHPSPRRKPISVWPLSSAKRAARPDGADTAATIGTPGGQGLLHDFEAGPPADQQHVPVQRVRPVQQRVAEHLVHRVVPAHVLAQHEQFCPIRSNSAAACSPPVRSKAACVRRIASGIAAIVSASMRIDGLIRSSQPAGTAPGPRRSSPSHTARNWRLANT